MSELARLRLVLTTFADEASAVAVVRQLVQEHMAACGTLLPGARSIYTWQGTMQETTEVVVLFKTADSCAGALKERLRELHPYEVPEILDWHPDHVDAAYASWVLDQTVLSA